LDDEIVKQRLLFEDKMKEAVYAERKCIWNALYAIVSLAMIIIYPSEFIWTF